MGRAVHVHLGAGALDASWEEGKHPRDGGKFSSKPGAGKRPDGGGSDYRKAREAEFDAKRDADYAQKRKDATERGAQLDAAAKAKAEGMGAQARKNRLAILKTKLDHMSDGLPLRDKVAITREMRALEAAGKGDAGDPSGEPEKARQGAPASPKEASEKKADPKKLRASYQAALKVGNMAEARRLLRELKKADEELDKGGSGK